ncbi:hypothetical protein V7S43_013686 [Phytophthora oleae]|uniref:Uncharacterized protein n=1 Tax=Phytophthora oleae TaxID=2107226 RepID=A0ABD3F3U3_9STRA
MNTSGTPGCRICSAPIFPVLPYFQQGAEEVSDIEDAGDNVYKPMSEEVADLDDAGNDKNSADNYHTSDFVSSLESDDDYNPNDAEE